MARRTLIVVTMLMAAALPGWCRPQTAASDKAEAIADGTMTLINAFVDAHWHKGEYNHIINLYRMIVAAHPDEMDAYANAGWLLWSLGRDADAVAIYKQGMRANPTSSFMYDELGQYYYRKKDYPQALGYYESAAKYKDVQPYTLHFLAHCYEKTGAMDKCLKIWERAAKNTNDANAQRHRDRVRALMSQNQPKSRQL